MDDKSTIIRVIYHLDAINFLTFIDNLSIDHEMTILEKADFTKLNDFNIHVNILDDTKTSTFRNLPIYFGLKNHIVFPTCCSMNMLGLVIMDKSSTICTGLKENFFR